MTETAETIIKENGPKLESLINDPNFVTLIFRRHTAYDSVTPEIRGFLTPVGYHLAEESAARIVGMIPQEAEVILTHSPSVMSSRERGIMSEDLRSPLQPKEVYAKLLAARAQFTARQYGKELYKHGFLTNAPKVKVNPDGSYEMEGIQKDRRLGDFLEMAVSEEKIANFYEILKSSDGYGGLTSEFWDDVESGTVKPLVHRAIIDANGWEGPQVANNIEEIIEERKPQIDISNKRVDINITHGETISGFLYWVTVYLRNQKKEKLAEFIDETASYGYNEGFEAHINVKGNLIITFENKGGVVIDNIGELKNFLTNVNTK